jgi:hypothetical protein
VCDQGKNSTSSFQKQIKDWHIRIERKEPTEGCERHEMGKWLIRLLLLLLDMLRSRRQ